MFNCFRRLGYRIDHAWWALLHRFHPAHRYNVVKTDLKPGYYDPDTLILHASFAMLCRYVEHDAGGLERLDEWTKNLRENPDPNGPLELQDNQANNQSEAAALYRWWKVDRPADLARNDDLIDKLYGQNGMIKMRFVRETAQLSRLVFDPEPDEAIKLRNEQWALEKKIGDDEQFMLHRLIAIRQGLWT